ncbi:MAG: class I SAM-dependent methyltransferase [Sphingopyxis sp.]|nr:class I SAM-dependent methyltransferase [Sphingopyxis sp.]
MTRPEPTYTPPAGYHFLTPFYDRGVAWTTRERRWREQLVRHMALTGADILLDVGAGTGNLAVLVDRQGSGARYLGVDPDGAALAIARAKTYESPSKTEFRTGHFTAESVRDWPVPNKVALCLVLHQVGLEEKARLLRECWKCLPDGGELYVADYGEQTGLMRLLFRLTIQLLDGRTDTQPNADGLVPVLVREAGFRNVREIERFRTITGSISIIAAHKAGAPRPV